MGNIEPWGHITIVNGFEQLTFLQKCISVCFTNKNVLYL